MIAGPAGSGDGGARERERPEADGGEARQHWQLPRAALRVLGSGRAGGARSLDGTGSAATGHVGGQVGRAARPQQKRWGALEPYRERNLLER